MRLPEFVESRKLWDFYRRFYIDNHPFVQFDDGTVWVIDDGRGNPHIRHYYGSFNVAIHTLDETDVKLYTPSLKPVPRSSINTAGVFSYLFDYDLNRVYPLFRQHTMNNYYAGYYVYKCLTYHNGEYEIVTPIRVYLPSEDNVKARKQFVTELVDMCKAYVAMLDLKPRVDKTASRLLISNALCEMDKGVEPHAVYCALSNEDKRTLAAMNRYTPTEAQYYSYLVMVPT